MVCLMILMAMMMTMREKMTKSPTGGEQWADIVAHCNLLTDRNHAWRVNKHGKRSREIKTDRYVTAAKVAVFGKRKKK